MRMNLRIGTPAIAALLAVSLGLASYRTGAKPTGAFATGHYRNLFAEIGHSDTEISAKVNAAYQQLFHGDPQEQSVGFFVGRNANGPLAYLTDWNHHDVRTEGMSYGMMIAVQLKQEA